MSETVQASDGAQLPLASLPQSFTYSGGFIATITVVYQDKTYRQYFENDGTDVTYISGWNYIEAGQDIMLTEADEFMLTEDNHVMITE